MTGEPRPARGRGALLAAGLLAAATALLAVSRPPPGGSAPEAVPWLLDRAASLLGSLPLDRVRALATRVSRGGLRRLSDADLVERMRLEARMMEEAGDATCAAMARGDAPPPAVLDAIRRLGPIDAAAWCVLAERAVQAEVAGSPPAEEVPPAAFDRAWTALHASLPPRARERLERGMARLDEVPDAEAAWTIRTLYGAALSLPEPHRAAIARGMLGR